MKLTPKNKQEPKRMQLRFKKSSVRGDGTVVKAHSETYNTGVSPEHKTKIEASLKSHMSKVLHEDGKLNSFVDEVHKSGKEIYLVGGSVRDTVLGRKAKDHDFVTDATPSEVDVIAKKRNIKTLEVGKDFGINVIVGDKEPYEVATMRNEKYSNNDPHRPESVNYIKNINEDLGRRDFTMNALAFNMKNGQLIDNHGGISDISNKVLNTVGEPHKRFEEDALRALRAIRQSSEHGLTISKPVMDAIPKFKDKVGQLSRERILNELDKMLMSDNPDKAIHTLVKTGLNEVSMKDKVNGVESSVPLLPELTHLNGLAQNPAYHTEDGLGHTTMVLKNTPKDRTMRYAALLHDIGKGTEGIRSEKDGVPHDYGHEEASAKMAKDILSRHGMNSTDIKNITWVIKNHMNPLPSGTKTSKLLRHVNKHTGFFRNKEELKKGINTLLDFTKADKMGSKHDRTAEIGNIENHRKLLNDVIDKNPFYASDLKVGGREINSILGAKGSAIGEHLRNMISLVQQGVVQNTKEDLTGWLHKKKSKMDEQ